MVIKRYINEYNRPCYRGVDESTPFDVEMFHMPDLQEEDGENFALHTNIGSLTIVDRMTGFGWRDIETGYRDEEGRFWLASGNMDVRNSGAKTIGEAIEWVKKNANTCIGYKRGEKE